MIRRFLSIDPGIKNLGLLEVEILNNQKVINISFKNTELDEKNLLKSLTEMLNDYINVDEVIIEKQFPTYNLKIIYSHCKSFFIIYNIKFNKSEPCEKNKSI